MVKEGEWEEYTYAETYTRSREVAWRLWRAVCVKGIGRVSLGKSAGMVYRLPCRYPDWDCCSHLTHKPLPTKS